MCWPWLWYKCAAGCFASTILYLKFINGQHWLAIQFHLAVSDSKIEIDQIIRFSFN